MEHYFTNNPQKKENRKEISFRFLAHLETFVSDDGVFSKDSLDFGSRLLLETLMNEEVSGSLLDLGCGIGYIGIMLKKYFPVIELTMSDVNETAAALAEENSRRYQQTNRVLVSDGFAGITDHFDIIVSNPPIRTGKKVIYELFAHSLEHLKPSGRLYLVIRQKQGAESALRYLRTLNPNAQVIEKKNGYWIILVNNCLT